MQHPVPLRLAEVAVHRVGQQAFGAEQHAHPIGPPLGPAENECLIPVLFQKMDEKVPFSTVLYPMDTMRHRGGGAVWRCCLHLCGIDHEFNGQRPDGFDLAIAAGDGDRPRRRLQLFKRDADDPVV